MNYIFLPHTADKKFQAFGNSLKECFANSAYALKSIFFDSEVKEIISKEIKIKGTDLENLMLNFLEEFLVLIDTEGFLLSRISFIDITSSKGHKIKSYELTAEVLGDELKNYKVSGEAKAITYNEMFVKEENGKYTAQVVVDV